jgi:hypothetical protein
MKRIILSFLVIALFAVNLFAQTPQYYNFNNGTSANSFPFNMSSGKAVNSLFLAGEINQPSPCPSGQQITKVYFRTGSTGTRTYTDLHILMAQSTITTLTTGQFYPGPWDTVYYHDTTTLASTSGGWMMITLDVPYPYDPTMSLVLFAGQCGYTGTGTSVYNTSLSGIRRVWSVGGCPFAPYASGDASMVNFGIDVEPAVQPLQQPNQWCSNFPAVPGSGVIWGHASVAMGDTVYLAGDGAALASNMFRKYSISGNTWTTGANMPGPKCGGDLVACGGKIYYIGGGSSVSVGDAPQYVYDPATGTWSTIANIPTPVTGNVAESYQDSLIYCMMGGWTSYLTTVQVYSVNTNTWTTATPTPLGRRAFAGGILGNKLFFACGYRGTFQQDFYIGTINPANPLTITWTAGPNLAVNSSRPGGTAIAGRFYVVLGESNSNTNGVDSIAIWDTSGTGWTYVDGNPFRASNYWGVVSGSIVDCNGRTGVKIWIPGGAIGTQSTRPLTVFSDTCLTGCSVITGGPKLTNNIPDVYKLLQNYPNPFNPVTHILYSIPKLGNVKLVVFDVLGRVVATLVNEVKTPGNYSIRFDATNLASGVYLYRIESGDFTATKKMVLIK